MKNKLIFRVLGALASSLIIAAVFIPFISVTGYSQSLWQTHSAVGTIYLPIMVIVFGAIGVFVFSTGLKTELAYASAGGLLFFLIMQTIPVIDQNLFNTLGVGYYCLAIGTILIVVMAFICGLKVKQKVAENVVVEEKKEESMIDQIDRLYNDQTSSQNVNDNNSLDNIIQPLPANSPMSIPVENNISSSIPVEPNVVESQNSSLENLNNAIQEVKPIPSFNNLEHDIKVDEQTINPAISEFTTSVNKDFDIPEENPVLQQFNPVVTEFNSPLTNVSEVEKSNLSELELDTPVINSLNDGLESSSEENKQNPVVSEFAQSLSDQSMFIPNNGNLNQTNDIPLVEKTEAITDSIMQPLNNDRKIDTMGNTTHTNSDLDIFG